MAQLETPVLDLRYLLNIAEDFSAWDDYELTFERDTLSLN